MKYLLIAMYIHIFLVGYWWVLLDIRKYLRDIEELLLEMREETE